MQRATALIRRVTRERLPQLVPCAYAEGREDQWQRRIQSCGEMIPFALRHDCPACGRRQARAHAPAPTARSFIVEGDVAIIDKETGEVVVLYVEGIPRVASQLLIALRGVEWDQDIFTQVTTTTRLSGMAVTHRTFGYQPPAPTRRRYGCCRSQFNMEHPEAMDVLGEFCQIAEHVFRTQAEDVYERTAAAVVKQQIAPAWRIAGTPWTGGIINNTASLPYHRDQANIPQSWSAMLGCRKGVTGGLLHLVDYDVYLPVAHGSISIFDGQSVVHGVTPLTQSSRNGIRVTVVTYSKLLMKLCAPDPKEEVHRAALAATRDEDKRALPDYRPDKT